VAENDSTTEKAALLGMAKEVGECDTTVVSKGHCVVYTVNGMRFKVPLVYHGAKVFTELLRMSQEEFGFVSSGHITLPCDAAVMEYAIFLLRRSASAEVEKAFLITIAVSSHNGSCMAPSVGVCQQFSIYSC
jgi:hypothetical protein